MWKGVTLPSELETVYHCELRLVDALRGEGITSGPLGMSKGSCVLCTRALESWNQFGDEWHVSRTHDDGFMSALPAHDGIRDALRSVVNSAIDYTINTRIRRRDSSPVAQYRFRSPYVLPDNGDTSEGIPL